MDHPEKYIRKILKIADIDQVHKEFRDDWKTWLPSDPNDAFLVCIGAGPWKEHRRKMVQAGALDWFKTRYTDISAINPKNVIIQAPYPLVWQNKMIYELARVLRTGFYGIGTFSNFCEKWKNSTDWEKSIRDFFLMCDQGTDGTKVLWLFTRDYLNLPGFPIDRHVREFLKKVGLPQNPWYITHLCLDNGIDPSALNRYIFFGKSSNYSWSDEDETSETD